MELDKGEKLENLLAELVAATAKLCSDPEDEAYIKRCKEDIFSITKAIFTLTGIKYPKSSS